jgi:hypothetical protein
MPSVLQLLYRNDIRQDHIEQALQAILVGYEGAPLPLGVRNAEWAVDITAVRATLTPEDLAKPNRSALGRTAIQESEAVPAI